MARYPPPSVLPESPFSPFYTSSNVRNSSESRPLFTDHPPSPSFGRTISHPRDHHEGYIEPLSPRPHSILKPPTLQKGPVFDPSTEYHPDIIELDDSSERYHLVGRQRDRSFHRMDMETQRLREKDVILKRNIRRFRFVVRSLHLACR